MTDDELRRQKDELLLSQQPLSTDTRKKPQPKGQVQFVPALESPVAGDDELTIEQLINDVAINYAKSHGMTLGQATKDLFPTFTEPAMQAIRTKYIPIDQDQLQKFEIAHHEALKGIDDYRKFEGSDDEYERTAAWINQLSPWNLERGVEALRTKYISREEHEADKAKTEQYARANEHHIISGILTNEDLAALSPTTVKRLKARKAELGDS